MAQSLTGLISGDPRMEPKTFASSLQKMAIPSRITGSTIILEQKTVVVFCVPRRITVRIVQSVISRTSFGRNLMRVKIQTP